MARKIECMSNQKRKHIITLLFISSFCIGDSPFSAEVSANPTNQAAQTAQAAETIAVGKYNAGCLINSRGLEHDGTGFQVMRPQRSRYYGHPRMLTYVRDLGEQVRQKGFPDILVGDISKQKGGPFRRGHRSHQTGLDVDIWFYQPQKNQRLSKRDRKKLSAINYVTSRKQNLKLKKSWTERHSEILKLAASDNRVDRIFVNAAIKKHLCSEYKGESWLARIRPWWSHRDHFHVRLRCPEGSIDCIPQNRVPAGTGCDETLAWWFSDEADQEWDKMLKDKSPFKFPTLPDKCEKYLNQSKLDTPEYTMPA